MEHLAQLKKQGCSQRQMASALRVSRSTIVHWLRQLDRDENLPPDDPPTETTAVYIHADDIVSLWLRAMRTIGDRNKHA